MAHNQLQWGYTDTPRRNAPNTPSLHHTAVLALPPPLLCLPHISSGFHQDFLCFGCPRERLVALETLAGARCHLLTKARSAQGLKARPGCFGRLRSFLPWKYGKPDRTWPCTACLFEAALPEQGVGPDDLRRPFPTSSICDCTKERGKKGRSEGEEGHIFWLPRDQAEPSTVKEVLPTSELMSTSQVHLHLFQN